MDGAVEPSYRIAEEGVQVMQQILGIRTDMDLRASSVNGTNVLNGSHRYYDAPAYDQVLTPEGMAAVGRIFSDLANPEAYPLYLHCTNGSDRTGTICFLLEALLGVPDEDLLRDYELSSFGHFAPVANMDWINSFFTQLKTYEGATTQEKTRNFLLSCGVRQDEIDTIRSIFLSTEQ